MASEDRSMLKLLTLKFMDVGIIASFGTVLPRTVATHTSVFHESDVFVTMCPTDQKSGLFLIVDFATNSTRSKNPTTFLGALSPVCAS